MAGEGDQRRRKPCLVETGRRETRRRRAEPVLYCFSVYHYFPRGSLAGRWRGGALPHQPSLLFHTKPSCRGGCQLCGHSEAFTCQARTAHAPKRRHCQPHPLPHTRSPHPPHKAHQACRGPTASPPPPPHDRRRVHLKRLVAGHRVHNHQAEHARKDGDDNGRRAGRLPRRRVVGGCEEGGAAAVELAEAVEGGEEARRPGGAGEEQAVGEGGVVLEKGEGEHTQRAQV